MIKSKLIILIIGLPGCGKTTLSEAIAKHYSVTYFSTEKIRAEMINVDYVPEDCDFTKEELESVYNLIARLTAEAIIDSDVVVVEGVFRSRHQRDLIYSISRKNPVIEVKTFLIECDEEIVYKRLISRKQSKTVSPAGIQAYNSIKSSFESESESEMFIRVENSNRLASSINYILGNLKRKSDL